MWAPGLMEQLREFRQRLEAAKSSLLKGHSNSANDFPSWLRTSLNITGSFTSFPSITLPECPFNRLLSTKEQQCPFLLPLFVLGLDFIPFLLSHFSSHMQRGDGYRKENRSKKAGGDCVQITQRL